MKYFVLPIEFASPQFDEAFQLRMIELDNPLSREISQEEVEKEYFFFHMAAFNEHHEIIGYLNLGPHENDLNMLSLSHLVVRKDLKQNGVTALLLSKSEALAINKGFNQIEIEVTEDLIPYYQNADYKKHGRAFTLKGLKHYKMKKNLS